METAAAICAPLLDPRAETLVDGPVARVLRAADDLTSIERLERAAAGELDEANLPPVLPHDVLLDALTSRPVRLPDQRGARIGPAGDIIDLPEHRGLLMREDRRVLGLAVDRTRGASALLRDTPVEARHVAPV
jgi:hypothetical protein